MKVLREQINKAGRKVITVELFGSEKLMAFKPEDCYKLGDPLNDIVFGTAIIDSWRAVWDQIGQEWIV